MALRSAVHALGLRFRLHQKIGPCIPDFVLPRWRLAVFVDGCYWHGCPGHSPTEFRGPNASRWREKIDTNRARDRRNISMLEDVGWRVLRVWECEVKQDLEGCADRVRQAAQKSTQNTR